MKQIILLILTAIVLTSMASADMPLCTDTILAWQNCTIVTPPINCESPTYEIFNNTGQRIENGSLAEFNNSMYQFNFTQAQGTYTIKLCDDTFRQVEVSEGGDNQMIAAALIIAPLLLGLVLLGGAATLGTKHTPLKFFLFLMSILPFFASMHFGLVSVIKFFDWGEMQSAIGGTIWWVGIGFVVIITYILIYTLYSLSLSWKEAKKRRLEY